MADSHHCPDCGQARPLDAPLGPCPACLLRAGLGHDLTVSFGPASSRLFASLSESLAGLPRILLRDTDSDADSGPVIQPSSPEMPDASARSARLQLFGEIARGGMGAVLKGRDPDLGRDLAVKVLLESHRDNPELIRRFVEEAQIAGQLQHPGIVPVYELGAFGDRRPYFAMKLVKGRTLASILSDRKSPSDGLPRLLSIFESVCQTLAYAHARGVIHRDLKPSNVMVGSFGEVQVMDWGLAKVLPRGGTADDASAGLSPSTDTIIATARGESDSDLSRAGSVMGTPSYMSPEQARGEVDLIDERADVFALGSILCELLTGTPAFTGRNSGEIQRRAARGDLANAFSRLDFSGSDPDMIAISKLCLSGERDDRPRQAGDVADLISAYFSGVQERLRTAELTRAAETARAEEATKRALVERDRFRLTIALAASVFAMIGIGGGSWGYSVQQRSSRRAATQSVVNKAFENAILLRGQAKAAPIGEMENWSKALVAANQARVSLEAGESSISLRNRVFQLLADLEKEQAEALRRSDAVNRDRRFLDRLEAIRLDRGDHSDLKKTDQDYAAAFRGYGVNLDVLDPMEAGRRLKEHTGFMEIVPFLEDWAFVLTQNRPWVEDVTEEWTRQVRTCERVIALAKFVDPDPWRNAVRIAFVRGDREWLARLAKDHKGLAGQPSRSLLLLGRALGNESEEARAILKQAWYMCPNDYWACFELARGGGKDPERFATAAVALRPLSPWAHEALADAYVSHKISNGVGLIPVQLSELGMKSRSTEELRSVDLGEVEHELREAIRIASDARRFHFGLAVALACEDKIEESFSEFKKACDPEPDEDFHSFIYVHFLLNCSRAEDAWSVVRARYRFAPGLYEQALLRIVYVCDPSNKTKIIREFAELGKEISYHADIQERLVKSLAGSKMIGEAIELSREAIRINPKDAKARNRLAWLLATTSDPRHLDGKTAIESATKACELTQWKNPAYLDTLAAAHAEAADFDAAVRRQEQAIAMLKDEKEKEDYRTRLKLYQEKKPYRTAK